MVQRRLLSSDVLSATKSLEATGIFFPYCRLLNKRMSMQYLAVGSSSAFLFKLRAGTKLRYFR
jgi:hypothetical protein